MTPKSKPQAARQLVLNVAYSQWRKFRPDQDLPDLFLVGIRGYYFRTMGDPNKNDRGIYDDAIFLISENAFASFNANTDPSAFRASIASLLPGVYPFKRGNHGISRPSGGYPAFRPATPGEALPVRRDGDPNVPSKRPGIAINIHKGSLRSTSSEGCQTIHPNQWNAFYALVDSEMNRANVRTIEYILIDGPIN